MINKIITDLTLVLTIAGLSLISLIITVIAIINCKRTSSNQARHERLWQYERVLLNTEENGSQSSDDGL